MKHGVYYCNTDFIQIFYDNNHDPLTILPRTLVDDVDFAITHFEKINNVTEFLRGADHLGVIRTYALGDILLAIPVIRLLKQTVNISKATLISFQQYIDHPIVKILGKGVYDSFITLDSAGRGSVKRYDKAILLDGILERDHSNKDYKYRHRVQIFLDWLSLKGDVCWDVETKWKKKSHIVMQSGGSRKHKELPKETREYVMSNLRGKGYEVVEIGQNHIVKPDKLLDLIATASCIITMDSAPLWISHFTKTPTILILGPTREEERLVMHPLYPERAKAIKLNEEIGCKACFENLATCKRRVDCFRVDKKRVAELILKAVKEVR